MIDCKHRQFYEDQIYAGFCEECGESELDIARAENKALEADNKNILSNYAALEATVAELETKLTDGGVYVEASAYQKLKAENKALREAALDVVELSGDYDEPYDKAINNLATLLLEKNDD